MADEQTVFPYLLYEDGEAAAAFLTEAFGFREVDRATGAAGGMHLEFETGRGGTIYAGQAPTGYRNPGAVGRTAIVYVMVDGVDAHYERAKTAGATITEEPVDLPFGQRRYTCRDPQGHEWTFAQEIGVGRSL
jgi:uncharacterized glyoxalase superfamily protein PhnB